MKHAEVQVTSLRVTGEHNSWVDLKRYFSGWVIEDSSLRSGVGPLAHHAWKDQYAAESAAISLLHVCELERVNEAEVTSAMNNWNEAVWDDSLG